MTKEELLRMFCSLDETRSALTDPWTDGDYSYASDGYTMIRVPRIDGMVVDEFYPTNAGEVFDTTGNTEDFFPIPDLQPREIITCPACSGTGYLGDDQCPTCADEWDDTPGKIEKIVKVQIGCAYFNRNYLERIQSLPNVKIGPTGPAPNPARIKFDGGEGLIMPIRME